jgi:hypothetical protein
MEKPANCAYVSTATPEKSDHTDISSEENGNTRELVEDGDKREYLTGVRLWLVLTSVTLVAFVMLLDMSIIVTASS